MYAGVELDYVTLTGVLVKHGTAIKQFMQGSQTKLKPLIMDLVQAVPDSQIDSALQTISTQYAGLLRGKA